MGQQSSPRVPWKGNDSATDVGGESGWGVAMTDGQKRSWRRRLRWPTTVEYALTVVCLTTWAVAISLYIGLIRTDATVLDGTAFTLLSAVTASWTGLGVWSGRASRDSYLAIAITALAGISVLTAGALLWSTLVEHVTTIPSNVAQLLILLATSLISMAGASVGYIPGGVGSFPMPGEPTFPEPDNGDGDDPPKSV